MKTIIIIQKGNKRFLVTDKKWSNGDPVLRLISKSCKEFDEHQEIQDSMYEPNYTTLQPKF